MNLNWIDWSIVAGFSAFIIFLIFIANRQTTSVADYLAANRTAGRYVISIASGIAGLGAISIMAQWEMVYEAGFTTLWWGTISIPLSVIVAATGYVVYRYRQTRAMTLAQFFEIRYTKRFRVFAGMLAFGCGIINFGLFPAVGSRFFIYFSGLPETTPLPLVNISVSTFGLVMFALLAVSVLFTWMGGQIAIILTDFFQGVFVKIAFIAILIFVVTKVNWSDITETLVNAPAGKSLINPFDGGELENFNVWFYMIAGFGVLYNMMAWQGSQAYYCSAKSPHEQRMAGIIGTLKEFATGLFMIMLGIVAYTILKHPSYSEIADSTNAVLATMDNDFVKSQMTVPVVLSVFIPVGLRGVLFAAILAAFVSTHDTMLHSWGTILIQDVIMPFRKKPFTPRAHIFWLRSSVLLVAVFIFIFSFLYPQTQNIYMFFLLTGSIFLGGAGSCIIGGLYWKKGTTLGAFGAMITGSTLAITIFLVRHFWNDWYGHDFPLNSAYMYFFMMVASLTVYIALSLLQNKNFNLDRMLHRGRHAIEDDTKTSLQEEVQLKRKSWFKWFLQKRGLSAEFSRTDRIILYLSLGWMVTWTSIFLVGTAYHFAFGTTDEGWMTFWKYYVAFTFVSGVAITVWLLIGGTMDIKDMFRRLNTLVRDHRDDGTVVDHHNLDEDNTIVGADDRAE